MALTSTNGLIAFFDLRNILCDASQNRHQLMFEQSLHYGIKIFFFNNFYYFIDFSDCMLEGLRPILNFQDHQIQLDDFKSARNSIAVNLQKEAINAINALIYNEQRKEQPKVEFADSIKRSLITNDIDQFMIPNTVLKIINNFDSYINSGALFSSKAYEIACESVFQKEPRSNPISRLAIAKQAIDQFNHILAKKACYLERETFSYNLHPFYILANLWKGVYYINHDLRIDASIQLRSVFETLVRSKFDLVNQKIEEKHYEQYCGDDEIIKFFKKSRESRAGSVHELLIPGDPENLKKYAKYLVDFFKRDFGVDISGIIR